MSVAVPFVQTRFERRENDHYPTVDPRCLDALLANWDMPVRAEDPCVGPNGESALIDQRPELFRFGPVRSVITNPPYDKKVVDGIVTGIVDRVRSGELVAAAILVRASWDQAKSRAPLRRYPFAGLIRLTFRPWWPDSREKSPIHNYQWMVWDRRHVGEPVVRHAGG